MTGFALGERYRHGTGPLYRLDARVKLLVTVGFALAVTLVREGDWRALTGFALLVAAAIALSRLPLPLVLRRSALALPFVAVTIPLLFTRPGETLFTVTGSGWTASRAGAVAVASIMLRSWLAVLMAVVLTGVTRPLDLIRALEQLKLPRVLTATVLFMYRYLAVIGEEGQRLLRARAARSAAAGDGRRAGGSIAWRARVLGAMVGSLFVRSFERGERVYMAMRARGYDGTLRRLHETPLGRGDRLALAVAAGILLGLAGYARR